jgi:hypothetical protein
MTIKISALTAGSALTGTEVFPAVQGGATVKLTAAQLATFLGVKKFAANIGDGTNVAYVVNHALNTRDVMVKVYRNGTPWDEVIVDIAHTDANNVTVSFSTAPTSNQFRVLVWA